MSQYLMRVSKAAVASEVQTSNARWKVILHVSVAALATLVKLAVVFSSILPFLRRAFTCDKK